MSKIILPFTTNVESKAYQYAAYALGAIKASINSSHLWTASKLLSIYFESNNELHMTDSDPWSIYEGITTQEDMVVYTSSSIAFRREFLEFTKAKIRAGYYVAGWYDEFFIPKKRAYLKFHFLHDYLLFGFDDSQNVFKSAGYLENSRYEAFDIPYDAYIDSITLCTNNKISLCYRRINNQYVPKLLVSDIRYKLESFLLSQDNPPRQEDDPDRTYGIRGLMCFQNYITSFEQKQIDLRNSRTYMEYFQYMYLRMQTLANSGYLCDSLPLDEYYDYVVKPAMMIHNMCIKYNLSGDKKILLRAGELIGAINKREMHSVKLILEKLYD